MDFWYVIALFLVIGIARPVFWLLALSASVWVGRKCFGDRIGRLLFGRYWEKGQRARSLQRSGHGRAA